MIEVKCFLPFVVRFTYRNWKGETAERRVRLGPMPLWRGVSEWHAAEGEQAFLEGFDLDRGGDRSFALKDVSGLTIEVPE